MAKIIDTSQLRENKLAGELLSPDHNHWIYNGLDCTVTYEVNDVLSSMMDDTARGTYEFSKSLQGPVLEMCQRGILVNQLKRKRVLAEMREKLSQLEAQFQRLVVEGVGVPYLNWRSPTQLNSFLYDAMNLPVQKSRKANGTYGPSSDRTAIEKLSQYFIAEPICSHLLALRDLGKSIGFLETGIDPDGRMRTDLKIAGTVTGRFSSSESEFSGTGTNLQNVTERLRSVFVADPGFKFANIDLEQGDSRNVGALCWELFCESPNWNERTAGAYLDACESGDLHTTVTKMTFTNLPWGTAPDREIAEQLFYRHFDYRYTSKKLGHGSNYLGQPPQLSLQSKVPLRFVKEFQPKYFSAFPCIPAWHENVQYRLDHFGQLTTPFGRRRYFFGRAKEKETLRQAVAHEGQSMTSDEINRAILNLWRGNRVQLLMQVHDSILFQFPAEQEDEIIPWALEEMKVYLELKKGRRFYVPAEAKTGWNWGNWSEDNPDGLKKFKGSDSRSRVETDFRLSLAGLISA